MAELDGWRRWASIERGLSPRTIEAYEHELGSVEQLEQATTEQLRAWLYARGGAASTVAKRLAALRSYFKFAVRTGLREDDPSATLDRPKPHRGVPRPVRDARAVIATLPPPYREIATLLYETGMRVSELWSFERDGDALLVLGKGSKERWIPLSPDAAGALEALGGAVPVSKRAIQRRFQLAGFTPHRLRHSFATELAEADVDLSVVQDLLGHASPATTRVYQQNSRRRLRAGMERRAHEAGEPGRDHVG